MCSVSTICIITLFCRHVDQSLWLSAREGFFLLLLWSVNCGDHSLGARLISWLIPPPR